MNDYFELEMEAVRNKLEKVCTENKWNVEIYPKEYPVQFLITGIQDKQIKFDEDGVITNEEEIEHNEMMSIFFNHGIQIKIRNGFYIEDTVFNKIRNLAKGWYYLYLEQQFEEKNKYEKE